ncbi:MAG TPA: hypothetical protein DEO33_04015, partial [Rikenellaceae bacterium]|nr:hypothetical protein [Rikenellaceae bacterium]
KPGSAAALIQDTAYGTVSTSVDYSELYSGFQLGVVNGMLQNVTNLRDTTLYEVTPYILTIGAQYATNPLIVSMKTFKKLSPDIQQALIEAGQEACAYERKVSEEFEVKDLVFLKSDPKVFVSAPSPENQKLWDALWSEKIEGMANKYYGKDLVQQIRNTK